MTKRSEHSLSPKVLLGGVLAGVALFGAVVAGAEALLPSQSHVDSQKNYGYVYSGAKSSSVEFNLLGNGDNSYLLFGSSELSTSASAVPEVPAKVMTTYDFGYDLTYVGEAYDQSLWHAMALGAYAPAYDKSKAVIIVSPGWFSDGGLDADTFGLRFSYSLYRQFCENPAISQESKDYLAWRLAQQGIDDSTIQAGLRTLPQDYLNDAVMAFQDDLTLRQELVEVRNQGSESAEKQPAPSFDELYAQARADAAAVSSNDWGIQDAYYEQKILPSLDRLKDMHTDETYTDTPEYDDLTFFLKVAREVGIEPLVVVSPMQGDFCDWEGISKDARDRCYSRIRTICQQAGVECADFSDREYQRYFMCDPVHFGWVGWVAVEEAIDDFIAG